MKRFLIALLFGLGLASAQAENPFSAPPAGVRIGDSVSGASTGTVLSVDSTGLLTGTTNFVVTPGASSSVTSTVSTAAYVTDQDGDGFTTPQTFNVTVSGTNPYLALACTSVGGGTPVTAAPTFNGDNMVLLSSATNGAHYYYVYGLANPDAGEHAVSVPWSDGEVEFSCEAAVLAGVAQTSSVASVVFSSASLTNSQTTTNSPTTAAGTAVFNVMAINGYIGNAATMRYASAAQEIFYPGGANSAILGMSLTQRSGATTDSVWTAATTSNVIIGHTSIVLNPATSASVTSGVVMVGDGLYFQSKKRGAGAPTAGDCDADEEWGRFYIDTTNNRFYICNGASRGWDYAGMTD